MNSKDIIDAVNKNSLIMDIKPHPQNYNAQFNYFDNLIKMNKYKKGKIIGNIPAEGLLKSYGLIILNFTKITLNGCILHLHYS